MALMNTERAGDFVTGRIGTDRIAASGRTHHELLRRQAEAAPDAPLVTFVGDRTYSRREVWERALLSSVKRLSA